MSQLDYGFEKFSRAAYILTTSTESIKECLFNAGYEIGALRRDNIPEEFREEFSNLDRRINSGIPQNREGSLRATVSQISNEEAEKIADDIISLNDKLIRWREKNNESY